MPTQSWVGQMEKEPNVTKRAAKDALAKSDRFDGLAYHMLKLVKDFKGRIAGLKDELASESQQ